MPLKLDQKFQSMTYLYSSKGHSWLQITKADEWVYLSFWKLSKLSQEYFSFNCSFMWEWHLTELKRYHSTWNIALLSNSLFSLEFSNYVLLSIKILTPLSYFTSRKVRVFLWNTISYAYMQSFLHEKICYSELKFN